MEAESRPHAEEVLRLLASAASAARLYPSSSTLPAQAAARFCAHCNRTTEAYGPLRYAVFPEGLALGVDCEQGEHLAPGSSQVAALGECLRGLQVGELILANDISPDEVVRFLHTIAADPLLVRRTGGLRVHLVRAGVQHIAVGEVLLADANGDRLLSIDLSTATPDQIASAAVAMSEKWAESAAAGDGVDLMAGAAARLEEATRDAALQRVAAALLRLDERTRARVLGLALTRDAAGRMMQGMLEVIRHLRPATLARLLTVLARRANSDHRATVVAIGLSPEVAREVLALLALPPLTEADCGVPSSVDHVAIAAEVVAEAPDARIEQQLRSADPARAAGRALEAAVAISRAHPDAEAVDAIASALLRAVRTGPLTSIRHALDRLDELSADHTLSAGVLAARDCLADPEILSDICQIATNDEDFAVAAEILADTGSAGADVLVNFYDRADEAHRDLLRPLLCGMNDAVLQVTAARLRGTDPLASVVALRTLPVLRDSRVVPVLTQALQDVHSEVRVAAVRALAEVGTRESYAALGRALGHWDVDTRRTAVREIGRVRATQPVPAMLRVLEKTNPFKLDYDLKKEIVRSLVQVGSPTAIATLTRVSRGAAIRRERKELRLLSARAVLSIQQQIQTREAPGNGSASSIPAPAFDRSRASRSKSKARRPRVATTTGGADDRVR